MTVQALVETFPWVETDVHVPLVCFNIVEDYYKVLSRYVF